MGNEICSFEGHKNSVRACNFSPDGKYIISGSSDNTLKLWNKDSGKVIRSFIGHKSSVNTCDFSPDGKYIISGSDDMTLRIWNAGTGKCLETINLLWRPNYVEFSPKNPNILATANANCTVSLFDLSEFFYKKT